MVSAALRNPHAVVVAALAILVIGFTSLVRLPTDILPTFRTPAVQVLTFYPGMPAEIVEKDITTRLERWTGQANGIARQESKSMIGVSIVKDYFIRMRGEVKSMRDSFASLGFGFGLAVALVYLVMVVQFRSFRDPWIVLFAVPLGLIGVAWMLFLTQTPMSVPAFMGISPVS